MIFNQILSLGKPSQLLVCETDGFSLHGAVLAREGAQVRVLHQARVEQVDMDEALVDLFSLLHKDGWKGGGRAILLSPAVLSTLVELPVNPDKPRSLEQMMELVGWEAEPLLLQHMARWSVGHLLVGQGYMTREQADAVMDLQQGKPNPAGGLALQDKFSFRRFGDLAEELGYIKRSQLNACLTGQEWLKSEDEAIECGWAPQGPVADVPGAYNWLVSCVHQSLLLRWHDLFARQGVTLQAMFPLIGCSAALLPKTPSAEVLLEAHRGQAFGMRLQAEVVAGVQSALNPDKSALELCLESYHALNASPKETVWLCGWQDDGGELAVELGEQLAIEVKPVQETAVNGVVTPGMAGAARATLNLVGGERVIGVREGGPLPSLPQRLEFRAAVLALVLLLAILVSEITLSVRHASALSQKEDIDARWQSIDAASKRIKEQIAAIDKRKAKLKEQKANETRWKAMLAFYNTEIPARVALVQGLLSTLQQTVTEEVIVLAIDENPLQPNIQAVNAAGEKIVEVESFTFSAWALSEAGAQTFIQTLQNALAPLQLEVRDGPVISARGPLNLNGYSFNLRVVRTVPADTLQGT